MFWSRISESTRTLFYSATVVVLAAVALFFSASFNTADANTNAAVIAASPAATFPANAGTLGAVPDDTTGGGCATAGAPRNVTFTASGMSAPLNNVEISMTFGAPIHSFVGDIEAILFAPGNAASHLLFSQTGGTTATAFGDSSDLSGPYNFKDSAPTTPHWWTAAATAGAAVPVAPGDYRAVGPGGVPGTPAQTVITTSFAGLTSGQVNGDWTLRLRDCASGDTGSISAATLTLTAGAVVPADANVDMDGDGKTDYVVARATTTPLSENESIASGQVNRGATSVRERMAIERDNPAGVSPSAPPIYWYTQINGSPANSVVQWGDAATDFLIPEDFDGDAKDDFAVWRGGAPGTILILQSTTNTARIEPFGQTGDDPAIIGDYDGDGKADPAVFRCPALGSGDGQCHYFYRGSNANPSGNITYVPWGFGEDGDFFPNTGDFDGDGKHDFCLQRADPSAPSQGQFVLLKSSNLGAEWINWGLSSDFILPGDYDGDGMADFCVRRTVGGNRHHFILERDGGGTGASPIIWGITGDTSTPGDYDGDGKQDIAVWRGNTDPTQNFFWILRSSDGGVEKPEWGMCPTVATCDFAVANWYVH